jgi:Spy/CpxP family protein refolding chaperone
MFAAALPTVAMAMPPADGPGPEGPRMGMHHDRGPFEKLDLSREQRQQIGKLMGAQMHDRKQ